MKPQLELLQIERERIKLERDAYRAAHVRFIIGIVVLGLFTTSGTWYLSITQSNKAVINSERQLIYPQLLKAQSESPEVQIKCLKDLLSLNLHLTNKRELQNILRQTEKKKQALAALHAVEIDEEKIRKKVRLSEESGDLVATEHATAELKQHLKEVEKLQKQDESFSRAIELTTKLLGALP